MKVGRSLSQIALACALGAGLAACSSSGSPAASSSTASSSPPASSASASAATGGAAVQKITANWTAFFDAKTPTATRISLLQNGPTFASIIKAQAGSGLAATATAKVTKVVVTSPTQAKVTYSILVGGQPALAGQSGVAVYEGGIWKVGVASFCGLLNLEFAGNTSSLPAACKTAG
ncbi:MAG: hypothetical protein QOJ73_6856 [Streptosporangiaceae bacterium]|jgi:hypothetical protein|nr:hypothetical protein [Streptosporangiaceae bacterium]